jgi:hypothetical protein
MRLTCGYIAKWSNLRAIKAYGEGLMMATKPLNLAKSDRNRSLNSALNLAGADNLAIAVGYEPQGAAAAYRKAARYINPPASTLKQHSPADWPSARVGVAQPLQKRGPHIYLSRFAIDELRASAPGPPFGAASGRRTPSDSGAQIRWIWHGHDLAGSSQTTGRAESSAACRRIAMLRSSNRRWVEPLAD